MSAEFKKGQQPLLPPRKGGRSSLGKFRKLFCLLLGSCPLICSTAAATFTDGFEGSSINPFWTASGPGTKILTNSMAFSGSQSLQLTASSNSPWDADLTHDFGSVQSGSVSVYAYTGVLGSAAGLQIDDATYTWSAVLQRDATGGFIARVNHGTSESDFSFAGSPGWHELEIDVNQSGVTFKFDGTAIFSNPSVTGFRYVDLQVWGASIGSEYFDSFAATTNGATLPSITTTSLPGGAVGVAYGQTLAAGGGAPPYSNWTIASGALPNGLTLNSSTGVIGGTPTAIGTFSFSVTVMDSAGSTSPAQPLSITIGPGVTVTTSSLPNGTAGVIYGQTLAASGGVPPYSNWTVVSGALPSGLTLSAGSGALGGTPTASGTFPFSVTVRDSAGSTSPAQPLSITIGPGVTVTTSSLPNGTVGVIYGQTLAASGGAPPYSNWTVASGALPSGLTLSAGSGAIGGTPTASGTFPFSVTVKDSSGVISPLRPLSITTAAGITVTTTSVPNGEAGAPYTALLAASGGSPPYSDWTVSTGLLPNGLTLNSSTGAIGGTPVGSGSFSFSVTVRDSAAITSPLQPLTITIAAGVTVTITSLPNGEVGAPYTALLAASGGSPPYSNWTVSAGLLPNGLTLNSSTGAIGGTPAGSGTSSFSVTVRDSAGVASPSQPFSIMIAPGATVTTTSLPNGVVGALYSAPLSAGGGSPPYSNWTVSTGALPGGMALNSTSGVISGTPTASGTFSFSVTVRDSAAITSSPQSLSITIVSGLTITTTSLPNGAVGSPYSAQVAASGGSPPYSNWMVSTGALPNGLTLSSSTGAISGTPTASGAFPFRVTVKDSAAITSSPQSLSITIVSGLTITTASLLNGAVGAPYSAPLAASGGSPPYNTWIVSTGALPNGLALSSSTGAISGTPTASGTFPFSVTVKDSTATTSSPQPLSITIVSGLTITTAALPNGAVGAPYSAPLAASGGSPPYNTWIVSTGALPNGLALSSSTGAISGTPTASGTFPFSVTVKDSASTTSSAQSLSITIVSGSAITTAALPGGVVNVAYPATTLQAQGGTVPYSWSATGLPSGLSLISGVLSGTPTVPGAFNVTVTATDNSTPRQTASKTYPLSVNLPPAPVFSLPANAQLITITDQPSLTLSINPAYSLPLDALFTLSFAPAPGVAGLPSGSYSDPALQFASGGTSATIAIGANSATSPGPAIQVGDTAGTITVTLASVTYGGQTLQLPVPLPSTTITVPLLAPIIAPGSVQITNVTSSGFTVVLVASSTPRDLASAALSFTAAAGAQLNGANVTVPLTGSATAWFGSAPGQAAGGTFDLEIPFAFSGDTSAIGSVSVTLTNSVGTSLPVSGGVSGSAQ